MPLYGSSDAIKVPNDAAAAGGSGPVTSARFLLSPLIQDTFGRTVGSTQYSTAVQDAVAPISPSSQNQTIRYGATGLSTNTAFSMDGAELVVSGTGPGDFADFYVPVNLAGPGVGFSLQSRVQVSVLGPVGVNQPNFGFKVIDSAGGLNAFAACQVTFNNNGGAIKQLYLYGGSGASASGNYGTLTANAQVGAAWWNILWTYSNGSFGLTVWPVTSAQPSPQLTLADNYGTGPATQFHFGSAPRDCTTWMDYWTLTPTIAVPNATATTIGLSTTDWNTVTGLTLASDGSLSFGVGASGKYWTTGFAGFTNASVPAGVSLRVASGDTLDTVAESANRASTGNANLLQTGLPMGAHQFLTGDNLKLATTQYSGSSQSVAAASLNLIKIGPATAPMTTGTCGPIIYQYHMNTGGNGYQGAPMFAPNGIGTTQSGLLISTLDTCNFDAPGDSNYTQPGGFTFASQGYARVGSALAYQSHVPAGGYSGNWNYTSGFGGSGWGTVLLSIKCNTATLVQSQGGASVDSGGGTTQQFLNPVTVGNLVVAVFSAGGQSTTWPVGSTPTSASIPTSPGGWCTVCSARIDQVQHPYWSKFAIYMHVITTTYDNIWTFYFSGVNNWSLVMSEWALT